MAHNWLLPHNILGDNTVTRCPAECPEHDHEKASCHCDLVIDMPTSYEYPYGKGNQGPGTGPDGERLI